MLYIGPAEVESLRPRGATSEKLSDAEAICRALISNLKNHKDRKDGRYTS